MVKKIITSIALIMCLAQGKHSVKARYHCYSFVPEIEIRTAAPSKDNEIELRFVVKSLKR